MATILEAIDKAKQFVDYSELEEYQRNTAEAYLSNRDVFVSAACLNLHRMINCRSNVAPKCI